MYHNFFIHSSINGHLGCFHVLAIVNSAAMNNGIHVSFSILISSGYVPRSEIAGSYGGFIPIFLRNLHHNVLVFMSQQSYYLSSTIKKSYYKSNVYFLLKRYKYKKEKEKKNTKRGEKLNPSTTLLPT